MLDACLGKNVEANAFNTRVERMCEQCFWNIGRPMLLVLAEHNMGAPSSFGERRQEAAPLCAPLVLKALASAYLKSIGHPLF